MKTSLTAVPFAEACKLWLETRKPYLAERTYRDYSYYIGRLSKVFASLRVTEITADDIRRYQKMRSVVAGPQVINHETGIIVQIKKRLGQWAEIAADYQPLPIPRRGPGRALTSQEEDRFWQAARSNPNWTVTYRCCQLMANTTMAPGEVRHLRLQDLNLERRVVDVVEHTKNQYRVRSIPLNGIAMEAVEILLKRAKSLGANEAEHYLVPRRISTGRYDVTRCASETFLRTAFREIRVLAGLDSLRAEDMRHHALTRLCENPDVSEETIRSLAGHVSRQMMSWYSHVRIEARREAVEALDFRKKKPGRVPNRWKKWAGER